MIHLCEHPDCKAEAARSAPREPEVKVCSRECPNNPGRQCIGIAPAGQPRSGRCVFKCAIDNDRDAGAKVKACETPASLGRSDGGTVCPSCGRDFCACP